MQNKKLDLEIERAWAKFYESGKIEDYLQYKKIEKNTKKQKENTKTK